MADQDYQTTLEEWLANGKQIDEYYAYLKQIVGDKLADIQDAKLKYVPAHIELPTAMYVYKPADLPNLATHLANSDYDDFSILWNEYEEYLKDIREAFITNEPQEPSFKKQSNYLKEHAAWSANQIEVEKFLADFKKALEKVQVEREKADEQYAFKAVAVEIIYDGKTFTPTNVAEFEPFVNAFTSAMPLISLKYHLDTEKTSKIDAIKSQNPADKPFFNPYRQSQETLKYEANLTSATQFFDALKAAIAKVEQEKKEQDAQHAYIGLSEYIVVHNEAGKEYVIGAGDEDYKTLLTKLDEADEKVFAELEAWSPDTIDGLFQFAKPSENSFFYKYKAQESLDAWNKDYDAFKDFKAAFPTTLAAVKKQFLDMDKNFAYHAAPLPLEWNSKTWGITIESDIEADPKQIAALGESDIKAALSELQTYKKGKLETIAVLKPDEEDFNFKSNFKAAFAEWETDKKNHEEFFAKLEKLYNDALTYLQNPSPQVDANASPLIPQAYFHWYTSNLSGLVFCDGKHYAGKFPSVSEIQAFDESSIIYAMEELLNDAANADSTAQSYDAKPTDADYTTKHAQWLSEHNDLEAFFNAIDNALHAALQAKQSPAAPSVDDNLIKEAAKYGYHWCKIFFQYSSGGSPLIGTTSGVAVITWDENHFPSVADLKKEKQNTLSITQTIFFTVQKKKIEEAIKNQHNPYSSTSKEGKVFNAVQNANLTRLDAFFAKLDSLFNQAQGITSGTTSGGATTGTTSINTSTSNGGYEWVDAKFEMTEGSVSHTFSLGKSVVYTLMCDFSSDYLKKSAQELIKQEDLSLQAVKAKELSSNVQTDNPDAYTAAYNDNLAQITAFWKEVKAGIQTAIKIKAGNGVGYNWIPVKYEFDYKGSGTIIWKEWIYPTEADLAQEPLDLLQYIDGDLSKYRDSLLDQVNAQNYANGDLAGDVIFKMARKANKERITSFFQDLTLLVAGAIDQKTGTSTANTYQWVDIYWEIDALKVKITPQSGVNFDLLKNLDIATLEQLSNDTPALKEHFAKLIDANKPDDSDTAAKQSWNENYSQNVSFWQQVNIAIGNAFDAVKANAVGYKWVDVKFDFTSTKSGMHMVFTDSYPPNIDKMMAKLDGSDLNQLSAELSTKKAELLNQITSQQPNANLSTKEQGAFTNGQKSNESRLKYFYQSLASSANYALLFLDADDEDYDEIETDEESTSTGLSNYQPVEIKFTISGITFGTDTFTPETGINIFELAYGLSHDDLVNLNIKALEDANVDEICALQPDENDYLPGEIGEGYDYNASYSEWNKNLHAATAFWKEAKEAKELALKLQDAAQFSDPYHWVDPEWYCSYQNKTYNASPNDYEVNMLSITESSFYDLSESELDDCIESAKEAYDKLSADVDMQSVSSDTNEKIVIDDIKEKNIKHLKHYFFDLLIPCLEKAKAHKVSNTANASQSSAPVISDPVYKWIDIVWNFKLGKIQGTLKEDEKASVSYEAVSQKGTFSQIQKLLVDLAKQRDETTAKILANEPIKVAYSNEANYDTAHNKWQENIDRNNAFWARRWYDMTLALYKSKAITIQYHWVRIRVNPKAIVPNTLFDEHLWSTNSLKHYDTDTLNKLKAEIPSLRTDIENEINKQVAPASLSDAEKKFFDETKAANLHALDNFCSRLSWLIDATIAEQSGQTVTDIYVEPPLKGQEYQWVDIKWTIDYKDSKQTPQTLVISSIEELTVEALSQIPNGSLKGLKPNAEQKALKTQIVANKKKKAEFLCEADYLKAKEQWEKNEAENTAFWNKAKEIIPIAMAKNAAEEHHYHWITPEWKQDHYSFLEGQKVTAESFADATDEQLEYYITHLSEPENVVLAKIAAQNPEDIPLIATHEIEAFNKAKDANKKAVHDFIIYIEDALVDAQYKLKDYIANNPPATTPTSTSFASANTQYVGGRPAVDTDATSTVASFRGEKTVPPLRLVWTEMTCKQLKDDETNLLKKAKQSWQQYVANAKLPKDALDYTNGTAFWSDCEKTLASLINEKEQLLNQSAASTDGKPPAGFPPSIDKVEIVDTNLTGSTGAVKVKWNGQFFIMKRGGNAGGDAADHLTSECQADAFYRAAGARVPEFHLYKDANGSPVKLSRFLDKAVSLKSWWKNASENEQKVMRAKLREQFSMDVLLGNWDVVGMSAENVMVDANGEPWRIDNGGALSYRAQGKKKTTLIDELNKYSSLSKGEKDILKKQMWGEEGMIDDLWTMTGNGDRIGQPMQSTIQQYYGDIDVLEMANRIMESKENWTQNPLDYLSKDDRKAIQKRLIEVRQIANRGNHCTRWSCSRDYSLELIDRSYEYSKEGARVACSFSCDPKKGDYGWWRGGSQVTPIAHDAQKNMLIQDTILTAVKNINAHYMPNGKGYGTPVNQAKIDAALSLKQDLQAALSSDPNNQGAKHYLGIISEIENAVANQTPLSAVDTSVPVYAQTVESALGANIRSQYSSFTSYLVDKVGKDDMKYFFECIYTQQYSSYGSGASTYSSTGSTNAESACDLKILSLRRRGIDVRDFKGTTIIPDAASGATAEEIKKAKEKEAEEAAQVFADTVSPNVYIGLVPNPAYLNDPSQPRFIPNPDKPTQWPNIKKAFLSMRKDPSNYDKRYTAFVKLEAAQQIMFENCQMPNLNNQAMTMVLMRTEEASVLTTLVEGEKTTHLTGPYESQGHLDTTCVNGAVLTMFEAPVCRIGLTYIHGSLNGGAGSFFSKYGVGENEVTCDTNGIVKYVMGHVNGGEPISKFIPKFREYQKKNP